MTRYLLDTHVILWWLADAPGLSHAARQALGDPGSTILASSVSAYEIAWKARLGKLTVPFDSPAAFTRAWAAERWLELPLALSHAVTAGRFTCDHRDPFDRQLAAQAVCEDATLVTCDPAFAGFPGVSVLW